MTRCANSNERYPKGYQLCKTRHNQPMQHLSTTITTMTSAKISSPLQDSKPLMNFDVCTWKHTRRSLNGNLIAEIAGGVFSSTRRLQYLYASPHVLFWSYMCMSPGMYFLCTCTYVSFHVFFCTHMYVLVIYGPSVPQNVCSKGYFSPFLFSEACVHVSQQAYFCTRIHMTPSTV